VNTISVILWFIILLVLFSGKFGIWNAKIQDIFVENFDIATEKLGNPIDILSGKHKGKLILINVYNDFIVVSFGKHAIKISRNAPDRFNKLFFLKEDLFNVKKDTLVVSNYEGELPEESIPIGINVSLNKDDIKKLKEYLR